MTPELVAVQLPGGEQLHGSQWTVNDCWTLMLHDPGDDHDSDDLAALIGTVVRSGSSVVAFDLPGHGFSEGVWTCSTSFEQTIGTMLDWVEQRQPAKVGMIAVGAACYPALQIAHDRNVNILVLISPPPHVDLQAVPLRFRGAGAAKLIVFGGANEVYRATATELRQRSIGWAVSRSVGSVDQGADLLNGPHRAGVQEGIEFFLREQWQLGRRRAFQTSKR